MSSLENSLYKKGQLVEISPILTKHEHAEVGIVSSYVTKGLFGELVAAQTIDKIFFGKPQFFTPYSPEHKSESSVTDFLPGNETHIALLSALNNMKELPLSRNQMLLILSSANMISAAAKFPEYKRLIPQISLKNVIREFISRCISNYDTVAHYIEQLYIENDGECIYIRCYGLQFSYKHVGADEVIYGYATSDKNVEVPWDGVRLQPIAYALYKFASEAYENDYDSAKVNIGLSKLLNPSKPSVANNGGKQLGRRKREKLLKFKIEQIVKDYHVGDTISFITTDNQRCDGEILQIDEHSLVITNSQGPQFYFEGYIKRLVDKDIECSNKSRGVGKGYDVQSLVYKHDVCFTTKSKDFWQESPDLAKVIDAEIRNENKSFPLSDNLLRILVERQLGIKVDISMISTVRQSLGHASYKERMQTNSQTEPEVVKQKYMSFEDLRSCCQRDSSFWKELKQGVHDGKHHLARQNGSPVKPSGDSFSFRCGELTVYVHDVNFASVPNSTKKRSVWCGKIIETKSKPGYAFSPYVVEICDVDTLQYCFDYYLSRACFSACFSILEYLKASGIDIIPLSERFDSIREYYRGNSNALQKQYPGNNIVPSSLTDHDFEVVADFLSKIKQASCTPQLTKNELLIALYYAFKISFSKGQSGDLFNSEKVKYNRKVHNNNSLESVANEVMRLTEQLLNINNVTNDTVLPTNAKILHFNGFVYVIQDEMTCTVSYISKKIMVGNPQMGHVCIVTAPNGDIIAATDLVTYGDLLSFFRHMLLEGQYHEFQQAFKMLLRLSPLKYDISGKIKANIKQLMTLRKIEAVSEYERISYFELDDKMKRSLVAYVQFVLESDGGFELENSKIRTQFEDDNNIILSKAAIQEVKEIIFAENPALKIAFEQYLVEHSDNIN